MQKFFKKLDLTWDGFFLKHPVETPLVATSGVIGKKII